MKTFGTLVLIVFQVLISTAIAAGQEKGPAVSLKAGQLTLKPVGKGRPVVSSDAAGVKLKGRGMTLKEAEAADQPISGRHVVLEFARRLSQKDYPALEA